MPQRVKTGIASFGMSGTVFHGPLLHAHPEYEIKSILERSHDRSRDIYPDSCIVRHFDDLCADPDIELIIVNTPDHTHYDLTFQALNAGKNVVVEKPFTLKYDEAVQLSALAGEKGLILSVFQNRRWDGDFLTVKNIIGQGLLGRLTEYESHFDRYRKEVNETTWKEDPDSGSGTLYNLGSHMIDQALDLFGMPEGVSADIRILRTGGRVDDSFDLRLKYQDQKVTIKGGYLVKEPGPRYILHGTDGSFLKWGLDPQEQALKEGRSPAGPDWGKDHPDYYGLLNTSSGGMNFRGRIETFPGNYPAFYDALYKTLRHGAPLAVKPQEGANVIRVIEAAYQSAREERMISL